MSWQGYVDNLKASNLAKAALWGQNGGQWATSAGFAIKPEEFQKLVAGFKDPSGLYAGGLYIGGDKYVVNKADKDGTSIYAKKGSGGVVCVKTNTAVVVAVYDDKLQPGVAVTAVEKMGDYLRSNNY